MTLKQRVVAIVLEAIRNLGTGQRLADYLGVTPQAVTNWKSGRDAPTAAHLIRMQDLVKKAACVLIALAGLAQAPESGATGMRSGHGTDVEINRSDFTTCTLCNVPRWLIETSRALCRRVVAGLASAMGHATHAPA